MTTNAQVAARFASAAKKLGGTEMRSLGVGTNMSARNPTLSQQKAINLESFGHFDVLAVGYSYSTEVAQLVHNGHTGNVELWMHVNGFSPTTKRHKSLYLQAFHLEMQKLGKTTEEITSRIYRTGCFEQNYRTRYKWNANALDLKTQSLTKPHRAEACQYGQNYDKAMEYLTIAATRPRLHDGTRLSYLDAAKVELHTCIRNVSQDIHPQSAVASHFDNPEFMTACNNVLDFIYVVSEYPIKQMRATVAGFVALHTNN
jgi:hypothetical protein